MRMVKQMVKTEQMPKYVDVLPGFGFPKLKLEEHKDIQIVENSNHHQLLKERIPNKYGCGYLSHANTLCFLQTDILEVVNIYLDKIQILYEKRTEMEPPCGCPQLLL